MSCCHRRLSPLAAALFLLLLSPIWIVGVHDRQLVGRAIEDSRRSEDAGDFEAAVAPLDSASGAIWLWGETALGRRRAVLQFRKARPALSAHADR